MQHLFEGLDLTGKTCISFADLLQMIRNAYPYPFQGFIKWSPTAPDVVTNPEESTFLWGYQSDMTDESTRDGTRIYYYNGTSWTLIPLTITDGSITLPKIDLSGASVYDILQVVAGPTLAWTDIPSAVQNDSLPTAKLVAPDAINKYVLTCLAGTKAFRLLATFFGTDVVDDTIPVTKLVKGAANALKLWLSTNAAGTAIEWAALDIANIGAAGVAATQSIRRNGAGTAWEAYTPVTSVITALTNTGTYWPVPGSGTVQAIPHALAAIPSMVRVVLRCATAVDGYSIGDEIDIKDVTADVDGTNQLPAFSVCCDSTNITVICSGFATGIYYTPKTGGAYVSFVAAKWKLKAYVIA